MKGLEHRPWRAVESRGRYTDLAISRAPQAWRRCLRAFATWLECERELALSSITVRVASAREFAVAQVPPGGVRTLKRLSVTDIEDFFIGYAKTHGRAATRHMQPALRQFLHFAATRRWVKTDLAGAVPSVRSYRLSNVPRGLDADEVRALVAASADRSWRDHAIVLLLAVYGVRRGQVVALRLQDIDWRSRTMAFRTHKRGKPVHHALTPSVAEALAGYLQHERPDARFEAVFLRAKKPHLPLSPGAITGLVGVLFEQLGLKKTPCGPHALRHAFATCLLHAGQPLQVIADLLGQRSLESVAMYAKVDHPRLLEVAREWPEEAS